MSRGSRVQIPATVYEEGTASLTTGPSSRQRCTVDVTVVIDGEPVVVHVHHEDDAEALLYSVIDEHGVSKRVWMVQRSYLNRFLVPVFCMAVCFVTVIWLLYA